MRYIATNIGFNDIAHMIQHFLSRVGIVGNNRSCQCRALPQIVIVDLGCRNIEAGAHAVEQRIDDRALVLQRFGTMNVQLQRQYANEHIVKELRS